MSAPEREEYRIKATCHVCGKPFLARYNMKGRAKVCTPPTHKCKSKVEKRPGKRDHLITCIARCCKSEYRRGAASIAMDSAIDRRKVLSKQEFDKTWAEVGKLPAAEAMSLRFIALTGCRLGEAYLVRAPDFNFIPGPYSTVRILTLKRKGKPPRTVHMSNKNPFLRELRIWVKRLSEDSEPVFDVPRRTLQRALEGILDVVKPDREGLVHILRHTRASQLTKAGADPNYVRQQLGWSSLEMAKIYTHTDDESISKVLGNL